MPCFSSRAKYCRKVRQSGVMLYWRKSVLSALMMASFSGATEPPSPVTSVVMPWKILDGRCGLTRMVNSDWPSMSMKPGATTMPCASMVARVAPRSDGQSQQCVRANADIAGVPR